MWDQTIVLPVSEIGELAAFARRNGDTWFLAVLNGSSARTIQVPLSFLGRAEHQALTIRDRKVDPGSVQIENTTVRPGDALKIELSSGGGFTARLFHRFRRARHRRQANGHQQLEVRVVAQQRRGLGLRLVLQIVARAVAAEVTRRKCFSSPNAPP